MECPSATTRCEEGECGGDCTHFCEAGAENEESEKETEAFDWDDDSIWKKESPVDKEKAPKKAPLLPSVPKPKLELSDDDWEDVPTKPDLPPKHREVDSYDWEDVPVKPTPQRKSPQETKKTGVVSDDGWEDVPQKPVLPPKRKEVSDDWEEVPPQPKKLEAISDDDDWNETPRASRKPSQPKPTTLSDDWEDVPQQPKKLEAISDDDWEDVPPKPVQVKSRKPVIDDWEDVPQEPRTRRPTRQSKNETPLPPKQQRNSPNTKDNLFSDLFDGYDFSKMNMEPTKPLSIEELLSMGKTDHDRSANKDDTERRKRIEECLNGLPKLEYLGLSVRVSFLLSPVGHSVLVFLMCILFLLSYTHNGRGSEQPRLQP